MAKDTTIRRIPDDLWERIEPLLPKPKAQPGRRGRRPVPFRQVLDGILFVLRTGCQWKMLPKEFGSGSTCHRRFQQWCQAGVFEALWRQLLQEYDDLKGIQWEWQALDGVIIPSPLGGNTRAKTPPIAANKAANDTRSPMDAVSPCPSPSVRRM